MCTDTTASTAPALEVPATTAVSSEDMETLVTTPLMPATNSGTSTGSSKVQLWPRVPR
jgi:hypothetical protein